MSKPKITQKAVRAAMAFLETCDVPDDYYDRPKREQEALRMAAVRGALVAAAVAEAA